LLQRSTHDGPVIVPAIPATVEPGEVVDWPDPIAGFEPVEDPQPEPEPEAPAKPTNRKRSGADTQEG
jgi:hypothetical protein